MKLATLACLAALCLAGSSAQAAQGEPAPAEQPRKEPATAPQKPAAAKPEPARPDPAKVDAPAAKVEVGRNAGAPLVGRDRRRRSYAACNRASHQRGYRGGKRRRFLIRCRLGYERTRGQQHQAPAAAPATVPAAPAPAPVRKP